MSIFNSTESEETEIRLNGDNLTRLNRVIDYVHGHYNENVDLNKMADIACLSPFHFHRQFNAVIGETPSQFIRRVRMEKAAHKLMLEPYKPITQIASECGFSSSQNFSRSFKERFHANPTLLKKTINWYSISSTFRRLKDRKTVLDKFALFFLKSYIQKRKSSFQSLLTVGPATGVKIKKLPPCRVAYVRTVGKAYSYYAVKPAFQQLFEWMEAHPDKFKRENKFLRGVAWSNPDLTPGDRLIYDVCIEVPDAVKADEWVSVQTLPGGEYAVFRSLADVQRHENRNEFMRLLCWLLLSDYRPEGPPYLNIYLNRAEDHPQGLADIDVCIPVVPLKQ